MKQQHAIINVLVAFIGWTLSPLVFLLWNLGTILSESTFERFSGQLGKFLRRRTKKMTLHNMQTVLHEPAWSQTEW
ncbi:MAG TPA: hypothetical protein VKI62_04080, partial [Bacteroidota bacterium]|nr:hypothetical protein [Bacteroidota bacterium]